MIDLGDSHMPRVNWALKSLSEPMITGLDDASPPPPQLGSSPLPPPTLPSWEFWVFTTLVTSALDVCAPRALYNTP
eukprot:8012395-Pyramimonas_sp.AAC.1